MIREKLIFKVYTETLTCQDSDYLAYVAALEVAYGGSLSDDVKSVLCTTFDMIKGTGTPNGSDLSSKLIDDTNSRLFLYTPQNDSTASFDAYKISVNLQTGTFVNMVSGNIDSFGVSGGAGKYLDFGVKPTDFGLDDVTIGVYNRSGTSYASTFEIGSREAATKMLATNVRNLSGSLVNSSNNSTFNTSATASPTGLVINTRTASTDYNVYKNGTLFQNYASASIAASNYNIYGHAANVTGTVTFESVRKLCTLLVCSGLTANEAEDLAYLINYYNTNIITGGRNTY